MVTQLNTTQARSLIHHLLGSGLGPSFQLNKSDERFARSFPGGLHALYIAFWSYPPHFVFSVTPAVRVDAIEKPYCELFGIPEKKTVTLVTQLWRFDSKSQPERHVPLPNSESPYFFTFTDEHTAEQAVARLLVAIRQNVLPFFDRIRTVADVHRAINIENLDTSAGRIGHGVVAAYLADSACWRDFAQRYRQELNSWPQGDKECFDAAIVRLEKGDVPLGLGRLE